MTATSAPSRSNGGLQGTRRVLAAAADRDRFPHNSNAEASVLGGVILRNEMLAELEHLEPDDFFDQKHAIVFQAIRNLEARQQPIDVVTLEVEVEKQGKLDAIGGIAFLGELALRVPTATSVAFYAEEVQTLARNRRTILALASALERSLSWSADEAGEMVGATIAELQRVEADHGPRAADRDRVMWCRPMLDFLGDEEPDDNDAVDWIVRDLIPRGEPVIWGGPMKAGKTWGVMDLCLAIALGEGWLRDNPDQQFRFENTVGEPVNTLGMFLEDNHRRISKRLHELARARGRDLLRDPVLTKHLFLSKSPIRLPDLRDQKRLVKEIKARGVRFVVVDNLTRVILGDPNSTRDAANFTRAWVEIGDETGATVLFLHHTKKPTGDKRELDPFDQLRGSADFGAAARNMIVALPLRAGKDLCAEVRMRGNLDLRCDSFALGFERYVDERWDGRWCARLLDKGDVDELKEKTSKDRKEKKATQKRSEKVAEYQKRRDHVLAMVHKNGAVTLGGAAQDFGLSPNAMKPVIQALVSDNVLKAAGTRGYVLVDDDKDRQGSIDL